MIRRALFAIAIVLLLPSLARSQGTRFDNIAFQQLSGGSLRTAGGAQIDVCTSVGSGVPCSPHATIYSDVALTLPLANFFFADALGNFGFYIAPGRYVMTITGQGLTARTLFLTASCEPTSVCTVTGAQTFSVAPTFSASPGFVMTSSTNVPNLNASLLLGNTWAAPGTIGGTTPGAATFTTATTSGIISTGGTFQPSSNDALSIGDATHRWVTLFLGEGGFYAEFLASGLSSNRIYTTPDAGGTLSLAAAEYCGATSGVTQACAKTPEVLPLIIYGDVTLNTATTQSITTLPFSNANYSCTGSDLTTAAGIVSFNTYANASVTIQESGGMNTDHLRYICVGF